MLCLLVFTFVHSTLSVEALRPGGALTLSSVVQSIVEELTETAWGIGLPSGRQRRVMIQMILSYILVFSVLVSWCESVSKFCCLSFHKSLGDVATWVRRAADAASCVEPPQS